MPLPTEHVSDLPTIGAVLNAILNVVQVLGLAYISRCLWRTDTNVRNRRKRGKRLAPTPGTRPKPKKR